MIHPQAFRVSFQDDVHHRRPTCGGMDSEYSHSTRERHTEIVVAPDLETAKFLWTHRSRLITTRTDIEWEELGPVTIVLSQAYGL